jgi:hypothetical protein
MVTAALVALAGANATPEDVKPQPLKKLNKISGNCDVVKLPEAIRVDCRPYPIEQGPYYVSADVNSIIIVRAGKKIDPTSHQELRVPLTGSKFHGKIAGHGLQATFPLDALSADSEVVVDYLGTGTSHFRFDTKSLQ